MPDKFVAVHTRTYLTHIATIKNIRIMKLAQLIELDKGFQNYLDHDHFTLIAPENSGAFEEFVREAKVETDNPEEPALADKSKVMDLLAKKYQGMPMTIYWVTKHFGGGLQFKSLQEYIRC
jgi:hypothetical protein